MNGARSKFLAGSGFAQDQDVGVSGGDLFNFEKHIVDGIALADHVLKVVFLFDFLLEISSLGFKLIFQDPDFRKGGLGFLPADLQRLVCLFEFGRSLFDNIFKMSFVIFALGHIFDGQQNHLGLLAFVINPPGVQMHYFQADILK